MHIASRASVLSHCTPGRYSGLKLLPLAANPISLLMLNATTSTVTAVARAERLVNAAAAGIATAVAHVDMPVVEQKAPCSTGTCTRSMVPNSLIEAPCSASITAAGTLLKSALDELWEESDVATFTSAYTHSIQTSAAEPDSKSNSDAVLTSASLEFARFVIDSALLGVLQENAPRIDRLALSMGSLTVAGKLAH
jgi:hypothetical protein